MCVCGGEGRNWSATSPRRREKEGKVRGDQERKGKEDDKGKGGKEEVERGT